MSHSLSEVNAAVLAVLAGWTRPAQQGGIGRPPARNGHAPQPEVYVDRLLGVRQAEALPGLDEIRVLAGTVVTPMALEVLKRRRVAVRVVSGREAVSTKTRQQGEWGFAIEATRNMGLIASLRRHWLDGSDWSEVASNARNAAHWVVDGEGRAALILADEASSATWRANRVEGVRAATVVDGNSTVRAVRHLGANVVVVEPATGSIHLIKQVAERFRAGGAPVPPESLEAEDTR